MANPVGDPVAVADLARRFRTEANRIDELYHQAKRGLDDVEWVGQRATETRNRVDARGLSTTELADELRSLASSLDAHARWMFETIRELEELESRIRTWAARNPPGAGMMRPDASLIGPFPGHCSFEWRTVAHRLRAAGAVF